MHNPVLVIGKFHVTHFNVSKGFENISRLKKMLPSIFVTKKQSRNKLWNVYSARQGTYFKKNKWNTDVSALGRPEGDAW